MEAQKEDKAVGYDGIPITMWMRSPEARNLAVLINLSPSLRGLRPNLAKSRREQICELLGKTKTLSRLRTNNRENASRVDRVRAVRVHGLKLMKCEWIMTPGIRPYARCHVGCPDCTNGRDSWHSSTIRELLSFNTMHELRNCKNEPSSDYCVRRSFWPKVKRTIRIV